MPEKPSKLCATCGRVMTWRKKWAKTWDEVRYCSDACRRRRASDSDPALEGVILRLLAERSADKTICPSEAARAAEAEAWERLMPRVRDAGRRLAAAGRIEVLQGGRVIDPATAKGPIRYRLKR